VSDPVDSNGPADPDGPAGPEPAAPEFSAPQDVRALCGRSKRFRLEADAPARARIAARLRVPAVERLEGDVELAVTKAEIRATGVLRAALTRECVASLEEMTETVEDPFDVVFLRARPDAGAAASGGETDAGTEQAAEDWDAPEVHEEDVFDLGEFLTQQLSLAMDPFPRKPGAESLAARYGEDGPVSPFADLAARIEES